jgi:dihydrofolate reductase
MPRLSITSFMTLDGVVQAPGGATEDTSGGFTQGGWVMPLFDPDCGDVIPSIYGRAGAFLLGRGTWQIFAGYWPKVTDPNDPIAGPLNRLPKYVATRTLSRVEWSGSTIVRDVAGEVARLKALDLGGELQVHGSPGLAQTLLRLGLVDELNLFTFPVVLGSGKRLFHPGALPTGFELASSRVSSTGVVIGTYRNAGAPKFADVHLPE